MKKATFLILLSLSISALFAACSKVPETNQVSGDVQVQLPVLQKDGSYLLQPTVLRELSNLYKISGHFAQFYVHPKVGDGVLSGEEPKTKFIKSWDGTYIPGDDLSLQMASIYMHAQNLAQLDSEVGTFNLNSWPLKIGVGVGIKDSGKSVRNNSFYDGEVDAILFVPYSAQDLPISVNGGIIAHEHFHSFFYKLVFQPLTAQGKLAVKYNTTIHDKNYFRDQVGLANKPTREGSAESIVTEDSQHDDQVLQDCYNTVLFKGMNEGFADFWGWVYTGDSDFISHSLTQEKNGRSLNYTDEEKEQPYLSQATDLKKLIHLYLLDNQTIGIESRLNGMAYRLGTQFSRFLKSFTEIYAKEHGLESVQARKAIAKLLIKSMSQMRDQFAMIDKNKEFEPNQFIKILSKEIPELKKAECLHIKKYLSDTKCEKDENAQVVSNKIRSEVLER